VSRRSIHIKQYAKKACGLFFLALILLNTLGYYQVLVIVDHQVREHRVSRINENEDAIGGNVILRIPMTLPYGHDDPEYRSAGGEIVLEGEVYHLVKQRLHRDTLYVVCVKDAGSTRVRNTMAEYSKTFTGQEQKPDTSQKITPSFAKFYLPGTTSFCCNQSGWSRMIRRASNTDRYAFSSLTDLFRPPCTSIA
jgi:hypothetical protein